MQFIVLRRLRQSEIGWFGEVRRQGRETSHQRAVNFDSVTVDRLFPNASNLDAVEIELSRRGDSGLVATQRQVLRRQAKNWRLTGDKIDDARFGFVSAGDLFVMRLDTGGDLPTGAFDVLSATDSHARRILSRPEAADLINTGLIALHPSDAGPIPSVLAELDEALFGVLAQPAAPRSAAESSSMTTDADPLVLIPSAARMFQVVGNLGHNLPIAVADLIDNSIAARADRVEVRYPRPEEGRRWLAIVDDGIGMDREGLLEAMRFGSDRDYEDRDLGKFGIGLKAASLSQARVLTVASRTADSEVSVLRWDQGQVERGRGWRLVEPDLTDREREILLDPLKKKAGTVVLWDKVLPPRAVRRRSRRMAGPDIPDDAYGRALHDLALHLGMVFHRFLQGRTSSGRAIQLVLNGTTIEAWDPFLPEHAKTKALASFAESLPGPGDRDCPVSGRAFILHHKAQFSDDTESRRAGYDGQWNQRQGLYIYRADRLIQAGGWCDLWQRDEHTKLLRVALSFDPELDDLFEVNAAKMSVTLPPLLAEALKDHLKDARKVARKRYRDQGRSGTKPRTRKHKPPPAPPPGPAPVPSGGDGPSGVKGETPPASTRSDSTPPSGGKSDTGAGATGEAGGVVAGAPPRLLIVKSDGARPWRVERSLVGGRDVRVDRNHPFGKWVTSAVAQHHPAAPLVAALIAATDDAVGMDGATRARVEALLQNWTNVGTSDDA